jgi:uncharacterized repeat protein (TIGR01451 family)
VSESRQRFIIVAVLILCGGFAARGQSISADNTSNANGGATNVSSLTWSHTVGTQTNRILIVGVALRNSSVTVTTVKYGAASLTFVGAAADSGAHVRVEMWKLVAPASGTANVVVTLSASKRIVAGAVSFSGVNQNTPNGSFVSASSTGSTTPSVNVASASGELVVDAVAPEGDASSVTAGSGQTQRWNTLTGTASTEVRGAQSTEPGAATTTMSWTLGTSKPWAIGAIALKPVPEITLTKSVNPTGPQQPGTDLAYTVTFTNTGTAAASSFVITDAIPANTDFKVGSVGNSLGTTGLTVAVAYSNNGGGTYAYTPVSGGGGAAAGYDRNVTNVRWTFTGNLSQTPPNNAGSVSFTAKIR